jgi:rhodanese-related sulfurtransferase
MHRAGLVLLVLASVSNAGIAIVNEVRAEPLTTGSAHSEQAGVQEISAGELKAKLERNDPLTILDVRSTTSYVESGSKIKGSIHVKLRRLQARLTLPPLKSLPRDREIVTYCACPADEASIEAAQLLMAAGFKRVRVLKNGWHEWLKTKGPVEPRPRG